MTIQGQPPYSWQPPQALTAPPAAIKRASWVMGAGGILSVLFTSISTLISMSSNPHADPLGIGNPYSGSYQAGQVTGAIIFIAAAGGLWAWMAWKNRRGRSWARIVSTVFFGLLSLYALVCVIGLVMAISEGNAGGASFIADEVLIILAWCAGLIAVVLIWQRESGQYYLAVKGAPGYAPVPPGSVYGQPAYGQPWNEQTPPPPAPSDQTPNPCGSGPGEPPPA